MRRILPIGVVLICILMAGWWLFQREPTRKSKASATNSEDSLDPQTGEYEVQVIIRQKIEGSPLSELLSMDGILRQTMHGADEVASEWSGFDSFRTLGEVMDGQLALVGKPILSSFEVKDQAFAHYYDQEFPSDLIPFHSSLLQRILVPASLRRNIDRHQERDEVGDFEASYTLEQEAGRLLLFKRWLRYKKEGIKVDSRENTFQYLYSSRGQLEEMSGRLTLHYRQTPPMRFQIDVSMKQIGPGTADVRPLDKKEAIRMGEADIARSGMQSVKRSLLSFDDAMKALDALSEKSDAGEAYRIFGSLKEALNQTPALADSLVKRIEATKDRDPGSRRQLTVLFGALAQAEDSSTSDRLSQLADSCPDNFCKIQAIAGINSHPNPTPDAARHMLEIAERNTDQDLAANAYLAVGSAASRLGEALPELPARLIEAARDPGKAELRSSILAAMGNHGSEAYQSILMQNLGHTDLTVRAAAVYSLRNLPEGQVDDTLVKVVKSESNLPVIRDAIKAMDYRNLSAEQYQAVASEAAAYSDEDTQRLAARMLIQAYRDDPEKLSGAVRTLKEGTANGDIKGYLDEEVKRIDEDRAMGKETTP